LCPGVFAGNIPQPCPPQNVQAGKKSQHPQHSVMIVLLGCTAEPQRTRRKKVLFAKSAAFRAIRDQQIMIKGFRKINQSRTGQL